MPDTSLSVRYNMWVRCGDTWNEKVQSSHSRHSFQGLIQKSGALTSWYVKNIKQFDRTAMLHTLMWKYIYRPAVLFSLKSICLEGRRSNKILILDLMCQIAWRKKEWIELKNTTFPSFESVSSECVSELWQWLVAKTFRVKCLEEVPEGLFHRLRRVPDRYKQ